MADIDPDQEVLIVSPIPVERFGETWQTLDLWARDVNAQAEFVRLTLICPVSATHAVSLAPLNASIRIVREEDGDAINHALNSANWVQIPGNFGHQGARVARKVLQLARLANKPIFLGISSDRAKTTILNSRNRGLLSRMIAYGRAADIRFTQRRLAKICDGVFVVGHGIRHLVEDVNSNIHVSIASWVSSEDIRLQNRPASTSLNICMAGRLEFMKGFHIGLDAIAALKGRVPCNVTIIGDGIERDALSHQAQRLKIQNFSLIQSVAYPEPFYALLDKQDIILMTNLNDEQPRLILDAISRGAIPICPRSAAYANIGLNPQLMYSRGNADDLAVCIRRLQDHDVRKQIRSDLSRLARKFTIEEMHKRRLEWMERTIENAS